MKASYIKTTLKNVVTVKKIVTVHDYEFDKNFLSRERVTIFGRWYTLTKER